MAGVGQDPFEEFEFRPINEGLGFHRRNKSAQKSSAVPLAPTSLTPPPAAPAARTAPQFASPLPRPEQTRFETRKETHTETRSEMRTEALSSRHSFNIPTIEDDSIAKAQSAVNEILRNLNQKRHMDFETEKVPTADLKKSRPLFSAAGLDAMLILAAFLMSMIAMLSITKVDLFLNLSHPETSGLIYAATTLLFVGVSFIYMVINRAFLGYTPGEWAYDQRCGDTRQAQDMMYIPRLVLRSGLVIVTGFFVLPALSYLFNKDIAGQLSGVNLYRKANA